MKIMKNKWAICVAAATFVTSGAVIAADHDVEALKAEVQELKDWKASVQSQPILEETKDHMVFFRGGWAHNTGGGSAGSRTGDILVDTATLGGSNSGRDAWYFGAGFDFSLEDNLWGLMDNTEVLAELMFDYKEFYATGNTLNPAPLPALVNTTTNAAGLGNFPTAQSVQVSQFQLSASPKIKFMKGSDFRPWIIPIGFVLNVISPPSDGVTVLTPGMMFAGGMDYKVWKNLYIGTDVRYQLASRTGIDGVDVSGLEVGGYLGIGF